MDKYPSKIRFKNKYQLLSFTLHNMPEVLSTLFENIRSLPRPILLISGQKDSVITEDLVYEAAAHLLSESPMTILEQPPRKIMENTSHKILQLQRRLIYILPGGHSIHLSHQ